MNLGIDVIVGNVQTNHIGVVKKVARKEGADVTDKLGNKLKPFEILFSVGDILSGARAAPLALSKEVNVGDKVLIYSMESIYNSTFYYLPIRNINDPKDSIKLNYNNAGLEIKPTSEGNADILLNAGNNLITVNSTDGTITLDSLNGVSINGGTNPISIKNDSQDMKDLVQKLLDEIQQMKIITPSGTGTVDPSSIAKFIQLGLQFDDLLGDVDKTEYYPVVPENSLDKANIEDMVRELGLDILTDEEVYISGTNAEIDQARESFEGELDEDVPTDPPTEITTAPNVSTANDPTCPVGEIKNSTQLSPNYDVAKLSTKCVFPHTIRDLDTTYTNKAGKVVRVQLSKAEIACNMKALAVNILEPLRTRYPNMFITSCIRTSNTVKGSVSQHLKGEAADIQFSGISPSGYVPIAKWIVENLPYDQIIFEHSPKGSIWIHVSYVRGRPGRRSQMTMLKNKYTPGLTLHYA